jgi:hypothetical protein
MRLLQWSGLAGAAANGLLLLSNLERIARGEVAGVVDGSSRVRCGAGTLAMPAFPCHLSPVPGLGIRGQGSSRVALRRLQS